MQCISCPEREREREECPKVTSEEEKKKKITSFGQPTSLIARGRA